MVSSAPRWCGARAELGLRDGGEAFVSSESGGWVRKPCQEDPQSLGVKNERWETKVGKGQVR